MTVFEYFCFLSLQHRQLNWELYLQITQQRTTVRDLQDLRESVTALTGLHLPPKDFAKVEQEMDVLVAKQVRWTTPEDENYPQSFRTSRVGPLLISYLGEPIWNNRQWLAVVGSRIAFRDTLTWLDMELPKLFNVPNWSLLSGGARGVDQKAHAVCIRLRKPTLCIVPSGLGQLYPRELNNWVEPILRNGGCMMSGFAYHSPMNKGCFHIRNRWIVHLSDLVLIAQAARKSGTAMTGKIAMETFDHDRVNVLPCSPLARQGVGGLDLICDGARMIRDGLDLQAKASRYSRCMK